jgi:hypothetical protein
MLKDKIKKIIQVNMPNSQLDRETVISPHIKKWIKQLRSTLNQTKWWKVKLKKNQFKKKLELTQVNVERWTKKILKKDKKKKNITLS